MCRLRELNRSKGNDIVVTPISRSVAHALRSVLGLNGLNNRLDRIEEQLERLSATPRAFNGPDRTAATTFVAGLLPSGVTYQLNIDASGEDPYHRALAAGVPQDPTWRFAMLWLRPGDIFFDLGANIGTFSIPAATIGARVYAFEMLAENILYLERSIARGGLGNVVVIQGAVGDHHGIIGVSGKSAWGTTAHDAVVEVPTISIDDYMLSRGISRVDLMKVDVEGSELPALTGSVNLLSGCKPDVIIESNSFACGMHRYSYRAILGQLAASGYQLYRIYRDRLCPWGVEMVQEIAVVDYVATVKSHAEITERSGALILPLSDEETIQNIIATDRETDSHRAHVLAVAGNLPSTVVGDSRVRGLLDRWSPLSSGDLFEIMRIGTA